MKNALRLPARQACSIAGPRRWRLGGFVDGRAAIQQSEPTRQRPKNSASSRSTASRAGAPPPPSLAVLDGQRLQVGSWNTPQSHGLVGSARVNPRSTTCCRHSSRFRVAPRLPSDPRGDGSPREEAPLPHAVLAVDSYCGRSWLWGDVADGLESIESRDPGPASCR